MWASRARDSASPIRCPYAKELQAFAQETIFSRVTELTTLEEFALAQQSLLSCYQALATRMATDTLHFPTPLTGTHRCVQAEYEHAYHYLKALSLLRRERPQPAPPPRQQPHRSADEVINDVSSLADMLNRPGDTYLGEERTDGTTPGGSK